jgi:hypothetical protein
MLNLDVVRLSHPHESHFSRHHYSILCLNEDLCSYQFPLWNPNFNFYSLLGFVIDDNVMGFIHLNVHL